MADFYIRNMDIETKNKLKQEARKKKVSLNTLVKSILYNHTLSPEIKNMENKYTNLIKDIVSIYKEESMQTKEILEEIKNLIRKP